MGLADAASVSYPGNAPASTKEKPVVGAAPIAAAAATSTVGSSDSNAPAADKAGSADNAGTGKPVASPPLFGTTGDHGHK